VFLLVFGTARDPEDGLSVYILRAPDTKGGDMPVRFPACFPAASLLAAALLAAPAPAFGEVLDVGDNGFGIRNIVSVPVDPSRAYVALVDDIGKWWDPAHTFSGEAASLSIDARPQGCWCERLPGQGGVRHMTVVYAEPGKLIRFAGGLGPLQALAVAGTMSWTFSPAGKGTTVEMRYVVGGYNPGGFKGLAPVVDSVLRGQIDRYRRYLEAGRP
jgi:hypothetical protein